MKFWILRMREIGVSRVRGCDRLGEHALYGVRDMYIHIYK